MKRLAFVLLAALSLTAAASSRLDWWTDARFGMFIHFGLYALPARGEWVKSIERMDEAAYDRYFGQFNPDLLDARAWARQAKAAGMKYMVLTAKHHDGFCLFDSKLTDYKSTNTPFGRDIAREFVEAARAENLKVGFYYSLPDWHHPEFPVDRYHPRRPVACGPWDKAGLEGPDEPWNELNRTRDMAKYREYLYGQVTELLTNYGKIDILWFDFTVSGPRTKHPEDWQSEKLLALVRRLQPEVVVSDRLGLKDGDWGDFATPEQIRQSSWFERNGVRAPWELCQTFCYSWGYDRNEARLKTTDAILDLLLSSVAHGGNFLLNVGPTGRGTFDPRAVAGLEAIGQWMNVNSRAVYGCTEAPGLTAPEGTVLTWNPKTRRLYMALTSPRRGRFDLPFADRIERAQMLHDGSEVKISPLGDGKGRIFIPEFDASVVVPVVEFVLAPPVKVIFDTDMLSDFDDVGALACLHALADAGECEILATVSSTRANASVGAIEVINRYYGRGDMRLGAPKGIGVSEGDSPGHAKYRKLLRDYPSWHRYANADDAPDANVVYRRVLAAQPDKSVVICSVGFLTNLRRLLETPPDDISPLDGKALVARKVKKWVAMACKYPEGKEYNSMLDAASSRLVIENWPTPIVFSDYEYGRDVFAGRALAETTPSVRNPVRDIFAENLPSREEIAADPARWLRGQFGAGGRAAWDETAVLAAVRGETSYFNVERGTYRMVGKDGANEWAPDAEKGPHLRLTEKTPKALVGHIIDELMMRPSAKRQ